MGKLIDFIGLDLNFHFGMKEEEKILFQFSFQMSIKKLIVNDIRITLQL